MDCVFSDGGFGTVAEACKLMVAMATKEKSSSGQLLAMVPTVDPLREGGVSMWRTVGPETGVLDYIPLILF